MKRWMIFFLLLPVMAHQGIAQETVVDSINRTKFTGVMQGGDMGQFMYLPYFTTNKGDKKNFIIRQLNRQSFAEEQVLRFELPETYTLKASTFNGTSYLLYFYDEARKEDVLVSATAENINKKKTFKSTGDTYILPGSGTPEDFLVIRISSKGDYTAEQLSTDLESKWKKQFNAPPGTSREIISVTNQMGRLRLIRKDLKGGNKYEFSAHYLQMNTGEDVTQLSLGSGETKFYPTFFSEKEGMNFTGGYYFSDGVYKGKPEGVFFASLSPDGNIQQSAKVPYSQVMEDLKSTIGGQLSEENTAIIFTGGYLSHETQSFVIAGQVITRKDKEGGTTIEFGDFVTVKFGMDEQFKGAISTASAGGRVEIKGNLSAVNIHDLGTWLNNSALLPFSHFMHMPGHPVIAYRTREKNGQINICYRTIGIKNDTVKPECVPLFRETHPDAPYTFTGNLVNTPVHDYDIIPSEHDMGNITMYELNKNMIIITKAPTPRMNTLMRPITPEDVAPPPHEDPQQNEPEENVEAGNEQ